MVVSGSPKRWYYKWYSSGIYCQLGDGLCHRSHLLGEPETTIEERECKNCLVVGMLMFCV